MPQRRILLLPVLALALAGCGPEAGDDELLVFAAASLAGVAPELGALYTARTGEALRFSFGSSAALARQVAAGAPADFLLAADAGFEPLVVERQREGSVPIAVASNRLVVVVGRGDAPPADGLRGARSIAIGDWRAGVPVGIAAREWLRSRGLWEELADRLVPCADARATLAAVATGGAEAGLVYGTDAASTDRVRVVERAGADHPSVTYRLFAIEGPRGPRPALERLLSSPQAAEVFARRGFEPRPLSAGRS